MKKILTISIVFCMLTICAGSSKAGLVFFDDFNGYTASIPWSATGNWTVTGGSVDMIGEGTAWDLQPGNGMYVDMDGTTGSAGTMQSIDINLEAGDMCCCSM